ncbi:MAG: hypothetical protein R3282_08300, partial [Rhodothermales bacterium]|nr:hypothetical protein [Rhodothermales bacterium]
FRRAQAHDKRAAVRANAVQLLGELREAQGNLDDAEELLLEALTIRRHLFGDGDGRTRDAEKRLQQLTERGAAEREQGADG